MNGDHRHDVGALTDREREVLGLMARGLTNGEIAERLDISFGTAKNHVSAVISKLGVDTREEAVRIWRQRQRLGSRVWRAMRGLVAGLGMWKMAAGTAAVAMVGLGAVAGVAIFVSGSDADGNALAADVATATPAVTAQLASMPHEEPTPFPIPDEDRLIPIYTATDGEHSREVGMFEEFGQWYLYERDGKPVFGIAISGPVDNLRLSDGRDVSCPGFVSGATSRPGASSIRLEMSDGTTTTASLVPAPDESGLDWWFWGRYVDDPGMIQRVVLLDINGAAIDSARPVGPTPFYPLGPGCNPANRPPPSPPSP